MQMNVHKPTPSWVPRGLEVLYIPDWFYKVNTKRASFSYIFTGFVKEIHPDNKGIK